MEPVTVEGNRRWFVLGVNPEPWAVGPIQPGRRGGKIYATMGRNAQLDAYKQAIAEELGDGHELIKGNVRLQFFFWRNRAEYTTPQGRAHRKHEADLTNLQKATEDALQGILFANDKDNNDVHSIVVEQGADVAGRVVLSIEPNTRHPAVQLPNEVWVEMEKLENPPIIVDASDLSWPPKDDRPF